MQCDGCYKTVYTRIENRKLALKHTQMSYPFEQEDDDDDKTYEISPNQEGDFRVMTDLYM